MQAVHDRKLLIDAPPAPPPSFIGKVQRKGILPWEAKGFDGPELPTLSCLNLWDRRVIRNGALLDKLNILS